MRPVTRLTKIWFRQITISGSICKLVRVPRRALGGFGGIFVEFGVTSVTFRRWDGCDP